MSNVAGFTRPLSQTELRAIVATLDKNGDGVLQSRELAIADVTMRQELDRNRNGRLETAEIVQALGEDRFIIGLTRDDAMKALINFDTNKDGYLGLDEIDMNYHFMRMTDGFGAADPIKGEPGPAVRDRQGRTHATGMVKHDGRVAIAEVANALAAGKLLVASRIFDARILQQQPQAVSMN